MYASSQGTYHLAVEFFGHPFQQYLSLMGSFFLAGISHVILPQNISESSYRIQSSESAVRHGAELPSCNIPGQRFDLASG
jgi:hypothetical protein